MSITRLLIVVFAFVVTLGCSMSTSRPVRSEFDDIPVPKGLAYQPGKSVLIESPSVKAARLVYRGRIEPTSLGVAMRTTLEANGWRHVNTSSASRHGTIQVFEKDSNALKVHIHEGLWYTYVEMDASRPLQTRQSLTK